AMPSVLDALRKHSASCLAKSGSSASHSLFVNSRSTKLRFSPSTSTATWETREDAPPFNRSSDCSRASGCIACSIHLIIRSLSVVIIACLRLKTEPIYRCGDYEFPPTSHLRSAARSGVYCCMTSLRRMFEPPRPLPALACNRPALRPPSAPYPALAQPPPRPLPPLRPHAGSPRSAEACTSLRTRQPCCDRYARQSSP